MISKKSIKEICIHEASHLFIAKLLGNNLLSMELDIKRGYARVKHSSTVQNDVYEAAVKVAGHLGDRYISNKNINFNNNLYASLITDDGIMFGDYDDFKMLRLPLKVERKIIRVSTEAVKENKAKIKEVAKYFVSRMDKNQNITIKKREINKLFNNLGIIKDEEFSNKLIL